MVQDGRAAQHLAVKVVDEGEGLWPLVPAGQQGQPCAALQEVLQAPREGRRAGWRGDSLRELGGW